MIRIIRVDYQDVGLFARSTARVEPHGINLHRADGPLESAVLCFYLSCFLGSSRCLLGVAADLENVIKHLDVSTILVLLFE